MDSIYCDSHVVTMPEGDAISYTMKPTRMYKADEVDARIQELEEEVRIKNNRIDTLVDRMNLPICVHCGEDVPDEDLNHWQKCEKHPANARIQELEEEIKKWQEAYRTRRYSKSVGLHKVEIARLRKALDWIDTECMRGDKETNGAHIIKRIKVKTTEALKEGEDTHE